MGCTFWTGSDAVANTILGKFGITTVGGSTLGAIGEFVLELSASVETPLAGAATVVGHKLLAFSSVPVRVKGTLVTIIEQKTL